MTSVLRFSGTVGWGEVTIFIVECAATRFRLTRRGRTDWQHQHGQNCRALYACRSLKKPSTRQFPNCSLTLRTPTMAKFLCACRADRFRINMPLCSAPATPHIHGWVKDVDEYSSTFRVSLPHRKPRDITKFLVGTELSTSGGRVSPNHIGEA
jgi:hypothetical protein